MGGAPCGIEPTVAADSRSQCKRPVATSLARAPGDEELAQVIGGKAPGDVDEAGGHEAVARDGQVREVEEDRAGGQEPAPGVAAAAARGEGAADHDADG